MRSLILFVTVIAMAVVGVTQSAEVREGALKRGASVPGSFQPYNVTARVIPSEELEQMDDKVKIKTKDEEKYTTKEKYHCLVTEYDLDPVVLLIARGLDDSAGFKELLKKLDAAISKNRLRRLRAFVVFLHDDLKDIITQDDQRDEQTKKVQKIADDLKLENVVLTLAGVGGDALTKNPHDLAKYEPAKFGALTAVLYRNLKIGSTYTFAPNELQKADDAAIKTIMDATLKMIE